MRLTLRQQAILLGIMADLDHFAALAPLYRGDHHERIVLANERQRIEDANHSYVETSPARWLGHAMDASDYVLVGRDYRRLEEMGLIHRHALGRSETRTTHIELTDAGRLVVDKLRLEAIDG